MPRMYKKMNKYGIMTYHFSTIPFEYFGPHSPYSDFLSLLFSNIPVFQYSTVPLSWAVNPKPPSCLCQ
jgi:hypothetical protein